MLIFGILMKPMPKRKVADFIYEKESYEVRGACFNVYNKLGGGIKEKIVERALLSEFKNSGLDVKSQVRIKIFYNNEEIGAYIPDFVVNDKIILELKSKPFITKMDEKQFWSYLRGSDYKLGFLVNFGTQRLTIKRFIHTEKVSA
jgi:GxxExxY protein